MTLPVMTTSEDVLTLIDYLKNKATGVTLDEGKAALGGKVLDSRKVSAYRYWGFIEDSSSRLRLSDWGLQIARNPAESAQVFGEVLDNISPYKTILEWAHFQNLSEITNVDVLHHWEKHHEEELGDKEKTKLDQIACFFRACEGANLGKMKMGRRGQPTRLEFNTSALGKFVDSASAVSDSSFLADSIEKPQDKNGAAEGEIVEMGQAVKDTAISEKVSKKIYITHGKNKAFIESIKKLLTFGELEAVISIEKQSVSKPVPQKVMDEMRTCGGAIIHVDAERNLQDSEGNEIFAINENVLIEIGAAMALYGKRFILLVREGVKLPSNLAGLYEVRYPSDLLDADTTIKLMEAINILKLEPLPN